MIYLSTYDEKDTGFYSSSRSDYLDAPNSLNTAFYLGAGSFNKAYGLLDVSNYTADSDAYNLGSLSAGTYTVTASSSGWFYGSGYSSFNTPSVTILNYLGVAVYASGFSNSKTFSVSTAGTFYAVVTGGTSEASQYELSYTYTPPTNSTVVSNIYLTGIPSVGNTMSVSGTYSDANGTLTSVLTYKWYVGGTLVSNQTSYTIQSNDAGKYIWCIIQYRDDAGYLETFGPPYVSISNSTPADTTAPTVSTFSPTDASTGVAVGSNIVLTFNETIARGTGNIEIRSGSATGTLVESFNAASSSLLTFSSSTLTINPTASLSSSTKYFVVVASGTVKDSAGNSYAGISTYDFTTAAAVAGITGTSGSDTLTGTTGIDTMNGLAGNDVLSGLAGLDVMNGGEGSDIYLIALSTAHPGAEINDTGLSGTDEVRYSATSGTLTLYAGDLGLETVVLGTGTASVAVTTATSSVSVNASAVVNGLTITGNNGINTLTGTSFADTIIGNSGNDILVGGLGNDALRGGLGKDKMTGGAGLDTFRFETAPSASTNLDTIVDFSLVDDTIELENGIFTALTATGALNATSFRSGAGIITAADANDYLIYNTTTGFLYYDANGSATGAAIQIATLTGKPLLTASDFLII